MRFSLKHTFYITWLLAISVAVGYGFYREDCRAADREAALGRCYAQLYVARQQLNILLDAQRSAAVPRQRLVQVLPGAEQSSVLFTFDRPPAGMPAKEE